MKILIIADEVWNDSIHGNNVLTNWFLEFPGEFAEIYCSPGAPENKCCKKYFQLTDRMMLDSFFKRKPAGRCFIYETFPSEKELKNAEKEDQELRNKLRLITTESVRAIREFVWCTAQYDIKELTAFVKDFNPDVIFCPRLSTLKLLRIERTVQGIIHKPMVAFTGDDEYSLQEIRITPVYWVKRLLQRKVMEKQIPSYALYYMHSEIQAKEYKRAFHIPTKVLYKCGEFNPYKVHKTVGSIVHIVYAGKLYCNRWKTLAMIGDVLKKINTGKQYIVLDIYTKDKVSAKQRKYLHDNYNTFLKGAVAPEELPGIYVASDIVLHIESFDLKNRLVTKYSFSTKIIDCLSSGCAVMAVCWKKQAGYNYLKKMNAAITAASKNELEQKLIEIQANPELVLAYAQKAYECGVKNHQKEIVQKRLYDDFKRASEHWKVGNNIEDYAG